MLDALKREINSNRNLFEKSANINTRTSALFSTLVRNSTSEVYAAYYNDSVPTENPRIT